MKIRLRSIKDILGRKMQKRELLKSRKILLNYSAFRKNYLAGVAVYSREMLFEIIKRDSVNRYIIVLNREVKEYFRVEDLTNVDIIELGAFFKKPVFRFFFEIFILPFIVIFMKIDLAFTPYVSTSVLSPCSKITVIHDIMPLIMKKYSFIRQSFVRAMMYISMKFADKIITVSESSLKDLEKFYPAFKEKVSFIYNGVRKYDDVSNLSPFYKKYSFKYILFVGTIQPSKNLLRLVEAYGMIENNIEEKLIIVGGRGWQVADELEMLIKRFNLDNRIVITGYVEFEELIALYANATFLAYPSLYEGFGFPPLEAMQYGTAVLASDKASIPEVCGDAALFVNPHSIEELSEKMTHLCKDKELVAAFVKRGYEQVKKFDWGESAKKMLKIFNSMILSDPR